MSTNNYMPVKKKSFIRKAWPVALTAVIGLTVGAAMGAAGSSTDAEAAPQVAPIVASSQQPEVQVQVKTVKDPTCQKVAEELFDMLQTQTNHVVKPLISSAQTLVQFASGDYTADLNGAADQVSGATDTLTDLTDRTVALTPDYQTCTQ